MLINGTKGDDWGQKALNGTEASDIINGYNGKDWIQGAGGNDFLSGGDGWDQIYGGTGVDAVSYAYSGRAVYVNLFSGQGWTRGDSDSSALTDQDDLYGIENVWGSAFDDDIVGTAGANELFGNGGNDRLRGGEGADRLSGGAGVDTADYATSVADELDAHDRITVNLATGKGYGGFAQGDQLTGIENVWATLGNDTLVGNDAANKLWGDLGADTLFGSGGNDVLDGGRDADLLHGGSGADTFKLDQRDSGWAELDVIFDFSHAAGDKLDVSDCPELNSTHQQFIGTAGFSGGDQVRYFNSGGATFVQVNVENSLGDIAFKLEGTFTLHASDFILA